MPQSNVTLIRPVKLLHNITGFLSLAIEARCVRMQYINYKNDKIFLIAILTHLAYIANGKKRVILCNNFTGRISVTLLCCICDVSYPDGETSF